MSSAQGVLTKATHLTWALQFLQWQKTLTLNSQAVSSLGEEKIKRRQEEGRRKQSSHTTPQHFDIRAEPPTPRLGRASTELADTQKKRERRKGEGKWRGREEERREQAREEGGREERESRKWRKKDERQKEGEEKGGEERKEREGGRKEREKERETERWRRLKAAVRGRKKNPTWRPTPGKGAGGNSMIMVPSQPCSILSCVQFHTPWTVVRQAPLWSAKDYEIFPSQGSNPVSSLQGFFTTDTGKHLQTILNINSIKKEPKGLLVVQWADSVPNAGAPVSILIRN